MAKKCCRIGKRTILKQKHEMNKNALKGKSKSEAKRNFHIKCFKEKVSESSKNYFFRRLL